MNSVVQARIKAKNCTEEPRKIPNKNRLQPAQIETLQNLYLIKSRAQARIKAKNNIDGPMTARRTKP